MLGLSIAVNGKHIGNYGMESAHTLLTSIGWFRDAKAERIQLGTSGNSDRETMEWKPITLQRGDEVLVKIMELADADIATPAYGEIGLWPEPEGEQNDGV
jgi:hypothetical protein